MAVPYAVYQRMSDRELKALRSKHVLELAKLEGMKGLFVESDRVRIKALIGAIDAERAARLLQIKLF